MFGPLKRHWTHVGHKFIQENPGKVISKLQFSSLFSKAWEMALTPANVISWFRTSGVFPLNPDAIKVTDSGKSKATPVSSAPTLSDNPSDLHLISDHSADAPSTET